MVATTTMITDAVRQVAGERIEVTGLMGPGVDPHLYEPRADVVRLLDQADLVFYNGLHLEGKMAELFERMAGKGVAITAGIDRKRLLEVPAFPGGHDPHFWFDVTLWKEAVRQIRDTLIEKDPDGADEYRANAEKHLAELDALHAELVEKGRDLAKGLKLPAGETPKLVTAHDAFNYFGRAYGLEVHALQGVSTEDEASIGDVERLAQLIVEVRVPVIFVESSVNPKNMVALQEAVRAKGFHVKIAMHKDLQLFSDALGDPGTTEGTYVGMMRHNLDTIAKVYLHPDVVEDLAAPGAGWPLKLVGLVVIALLAGVSLLVVATMMKR